MKWEIKDINVGNIILGERTRQKYGSLYEKILSLRVGKGIEIEAESMKEASNIRKSVSAMLKKKGLSDKYIATNNLNVFQCGRTK